MDDIQKESSTVVDIDPEGDVYLVFPKKELRVSSKVLSVASTVFKALLGPKFSEGQALSSQLPGRVALPDDDTEAMEAICNVLHHRYYFSIPDPKARFMVEVAVASDKYDCTKAVSQWASAQLRGPIRIAASSPDQGQLLVASYTLHDREGFMEMTKYLCYTPWHLTHVDIFASSPHGIFKRHLYLLPKRLIGQITCTEWYIKKTLLAALEGLLVSSKPVPDGQYQRHDGTEESTCDQKRLSLLIRHLSEFHLFPTAQASVKTIHELGEQLSLFMASDVSALDCGHCTMGTFIYEKILEILDTASKGFEGLCLDCVNRGAEGDEPKCLIPHEGYLGLVDNIQPDMGSGKRKRKR